MAAKKRTDLIGRVADISEEAVQRLRLSEAPGAERVLATMNALRERTEELQKRVRGVETLEQRLEALERKVDKLIKGDSKASSTARKSTKAPSTKHADGTAAKES